jgi:hypothetical protein
MVEPLFEQVVLDRPHAYGLQWHGRVVAHLWWDQDPAHRAALGWYLRDLRAPAHTWPLDVDAAVDALAGDLRRPAPLWCEDAERLRALTMALALRRAELLLGPTLGLPTTTRDTGPLVGYDVSVRGASVETLALAFPDVAITERGELRIMHARLTRRALSRLLARIATLGATVVAVVPEDTDP